MIALLAQMPGSLMHVWDYALPRVLALGGHSACSRQSLHLVPASSLAPAPALSRVRTHHVCGPHATLAVASSMYISDEDFTASPGSSPALKATGIEFLHREKKHLETVNKETIFSAGGPMNFWSLYLKNGGSLHL